ncbi:MAG: hypothetical protein K2J77_11730 [Oscillospiraceae bacterium]|nr:hypothetical protein [Oscillospiraceae bacterium]
MDFFIMLIYGTIFYGIGVAIPLGLTVLNIYNLFSKKPILPRVAALATLIVGGVLYLMLFGMEFSTAGDWYEQIYEMQLHYSISSDFGWAAEVPAVLGLIGLLALIFLDARKMPPLVSAFSIAGVVLLNVFQIALAIQLAKNISGWALMLYVYHANVFIISVSAVKKQIKQQLEIFEEQGSEDKSRLYRLMSSAAGYSALVFLCLFFVIAVLEIIFILTGEGADAPIKAFKDTADWTFSRQIPPPPKHYEGHYLCTVAAGGHKKIVKPLRYGTRHGATIIVNRQLCIANAFEDFIHEKLPKFHKLIRGAYDKYGYPISKHITTPRRADAVYILMKPLEWVFLIFLYMFDTKPEQRISRQYLYRG